MYGSRVCIGYRVMGYRYTPGGYTGRAGSSPLALYTLMDYPTTCTLRLGYSIQAVYIYALCICIYMDIDI